VGRVPPKAEAVGGGPGGLLIAAERLPELLAVHPDAILDPQITAPPSRAARTWTRAEAIVELLRGRLAVTGPVTAATLASSLGIPEADADEALLALEGEGVVLRGNFTSAIRLKPDSTTAAPPLEWCERRLLARIHRYTLNRLRAEIAPVSPAEFMRFLFAWQHVEPGSQLIGAEGLRAVVAQLDGVELPARAWERDVLPARVDRYEPAMLDMLCLTGDVAWARLSSGPTQVVGATPIALYMRAARPTRVQDRESTDSQSASVVFEHLRTRGASFATEIATACGVDEEAVRAALTELVAAGAVSSDGFAGLRTIIGTRPTTATGRWFLVNAGEEPAAEAVAWTLLRRYGVICRRLLARETTSITWRELVHVYRRLEARGEIRGGRFVSGMSGEQYALPDAVERLREIRRTPADDRLVTISAADPLNLTGIVTPGDRLRTVAANRIVYLHGVPVSAMEGDMLRVLAPVEAARAAAVAEAAAGRRVPVVSGYVGRK
jgi:ATP-dependent Lhr-like helicase